MTTTLDDLDSLYQISYRLYLALATVTNNSRERIDRRGQVHKRFLDLEKELERIHEKYSLVGDQAGPKSVEG